MQTLTVFIEDDASVTFLKSPLAAGFNLGPSVTRRYSSVEPDAAILRLVFHTLRLLFGETGAVSDFTRGWTCLWRARIHGGPTLTGRWYNRQDAINAEIAYFNIHGVKHDRH
jgi:hypothetical protein